METASNEILTVIIAVIVILVFIALFVLVMLIYFNNKKLKNIREKEKMKQDYEQALLQTQLDVQEQTMRHISQEIHDNVGQVLSLANLNLQTMMVYDSTKINNTSTLVNKAITDLRNLSRSLNPENIARQGIIQVLRNELAQLESTGKFRTSLKVEDEIALDPKKAIILYRMIQEMISNIIRHSAATEVSASISRLSLSITDNGKGFDNSLEAAGIGLQNLKQRASTIGGTLDVNAVDGKGTIITFKLNTHSE